MTWHVACEAQTISCFISSQSKFPVDRFCVHCVVERRVQLLLYRTSLIGTLQISRARHPCGQWLRRRLATRSAHQKRRRRVRGARPPTGYERRPARYPAGRVGARLRLREGRASGSAHSRPSVLANELPRVRYIVIAPPRRPLSSLLARKTSSTLTWPTPDRPHRRVGSTIHATHATPSRQFCVGDFVIAAGCGSFYSKRS